MTLTILLLILGVALCVVIWASGLLDEFLSEHDTEEDEIYTGEKTAYEVLYTVPSGWYHSDEDVNLGRARKAFIAALMLNDYVDAHKITGRYNKNGRSYVEAVAISRLDERSFRNRFEGGNWNRKYEVL